MIPLLFSVLLLASDASGATASPSSDPAEQAAPVKKEAKEKKICKTDPAYTGSRYKKQICLTAAGWEKRRVDGLQNASQMGRSYTAEQ